MSRTTDPASAQAFIVGRNQATPFPVGQLASHDAYIDALFNRYGQSHSARYARIRASAGKAGSPTRANTERLTTLLERHGVSGVLETNVICYSSPMSADLSMESHRGGKEAGTRIFRELLSAVQPRILIVHGEGTRADVGKILSQALPPPPTGPEDELARSAVTLGGASGTRPSAVFVIPSLAPPGWNRWSRWAPAYLERLAIAAAGILARSEIEA
ncbi:MAG TPA: hypothetical protein VGP44_01265 [Gemmatimonadales bacterium]|nr:hypothetical protein [Gemmatimonadales bacterium]